MRDATLEEIGSLALLYIFLSVLGYMNLIELMGSMVSVLRSRRIPMCRHRLGRPFELDTRLDCSHVSGYADGI